ncbi:MAG: rhomboid family intramembrane serine protease [Bacteroidota bacterium]|jgi:membrane associated rhomboid family serine protease|nr:rhomboid family intramembrane serine protease [Ignavibacteria bacterium]MCU7498993.1 rhomboid family intramembrane serine protease [Ignavibacteria bacterium]MCU7512432.1 rhomboid family intramembrane serine protease [Ignavibacteria bacterium]MCU7518597.1 rhomboid family intramembrane serine protease [Ignavibacteria bacterium]MCU7524281.1 rhomboid family intramembrane serine protease [Ignavibacteria bacterium]
MYSERDYYRPTGFGGFSFFPPVIKNLLIINVVVFLVTNLILSSVSVDGVIASDKINQYFALMPLGHGFFIWQLITYQFLHGSFSHIFFNMFALWMFGMEIENLWGSKKFLIFYLVCGIGGGLAHLLLSPVIADMMAPTIGASGAIYGVMIAFAMMFPDRYIFIYFLIPVKAKYLIAFLVVLEFLSAGDMSLVAHLAHIGGAVVGFAFILLDSRSGFSLRNIFSSYKKPYSPRQAQFRRRPFINNDEKVVDADYYEINKKEENPITQEEIDRILDKISQSGYQNLTEREKKILFEASKRS